MFKVYDKVHGWFVNDGDNGVAIYTDAKAKMCVKLGVKFYNEIQELGRRWSKKDFEIVPA